MPPVFTEETISDFKLAFDNHLEPSLEEQARLEHLRDFYLFIGGFERKDRDSSQFRNLGLAPSRRHLREPVILMLLEAYMGNFKQAIKHLKQHGIPPTNDQFFSLEIDWPSVTPEDHNSLNMCQLMQKYGQKTPLERWEPLALSDLAAGTIKVRPVVELLQEYGRKSFVSGYQRLSPA